MANSRKYRDLSKNTLLFTISSFGARIISFLLVPLYTYVLSTEDYGNVDVITTTVQLLIPVLTLNIQDAVLRFSLDKEYNSEDALSAGLKVIGLSSVLLGLVLCAINSLSIIKLDTQYLYFLFLSYFFGVVYNCFSMYLKAKNRVFVLMISGLVNTFLTCALNVLLLLVVKTGVTGYLISNISGTIVAVLIAFFFGYIYKEVRIKKGSTILKYMIPYSLPLVVNSLAWWLNNASDRYILTYFCGASVNGIYAVAYKIPTILATIQTVFYNAWSVSAITEYDKDDSDGFIGNVYSLYSAASFIVCSLLMIGNIYIAQILYKGEFFSAWRYVPPLLLGTVFNGIALFQGCIFTAVKKTKDVSVTTIVGAVVNTLLNFILIPYIGALGAALATLVGYVSIWLVRTWQLRYIVNMKVEWKNQLVTILFLSIQMIITLFGNYYWLQIILLVGILFLQRKQLFNIYNYVKNQMWFNEKR